MANRLTIMFRDWARRWDNWVGDRSLEFAIRAEANSQGYAGRPINILMFRLAAIQRPGWVCVYEFVVETTGEDGNPETLFGVARDDARTKSRVKLFKNQKARDDQRADWSDGLILAPSLRKTQRNT